MSVDISSIDEASKRLEGVAKRTPLELSRRLSEKYSAEIYIKREDQQYIRSFKIRGAYNKMVVLSQEEKEKGVVCSSAGNHAQGVALSCSTLKIKGTIFMPAITPQQKVDKVRKFGGEYVEVMLTGITFDDAAASAREYAQRTGAVFVHAFNDDYTISGQGTVGKEIYEDMNGEIDYVFSCVGGGGLVAGIGAYMKQKNEKIQVVGVEPQGAAGMYLSIKNNEITMVENMDTFVDGAAVGRVGEKSFELCKKYVDRILVVPEGKVCSEIIGLYQNEGIIAEPAGALAVSGLDEMRDEIKGKKVVCVLSGGNNDILRYPEIIERSLMYEGLKHYFIINFAQKPGELMRFLEDSLGPNDDIVRFEYVKKTNAEKGPAFVGIIQKSKDDYEPLIKRMDENKINYKVITKDNLLYKYLV